MLSEKIPPQKILATPLTKVNCQQTGYEIEHSESKTAKLFTNFNGLFKFYLIA